MNESRTAWLQSHVGRPAFGGPVFDAHFHIIDHRFPLQANQGFLPEPFPVDEHCRVLGTATTGLDLPHHSTGRNARAADGAAERVQNQPASCRDG